MELTFQQLKVNYEFMKALRKMIYSPGFRDGIEIPPTVENDYDWILIDTTNDINEEDGIEDQLNAIDMGY